MFGERFSVFLEYSARRSTSAACDGVGEGPTARDAGFRPPYVSF